MVSPERISAASLPIVRIGTVCNFGVTTCNVNKQCILSLKNFEKVQDSGPRRGAHSAPPPPPPPDPRAGFTAVSP